MSKSRRASCKRFLRDTRTRKCEAVRLLGRFHREVEMRFTCRINPVEGFTRFDLVADALQHIDASAAIEGSAREPCELCNSQTIDGCDDAIGMSENITVSGPGAGDDEARP